MAIDFLLDEFPKELTLKDTACTLRPLEASDEQALYDFFQALPAPDLLYIKHRVADPAIIHDWCQNIDLGRNFPLLAFHPSGVVGVATLHQQLGGWKRHIGRVSVHIHPRFRGRGLAREMIGEITEVARQSGLEKIEAEFIAEQATAMKLFSWIGFREVLRLPDYVKDMQAVTHDYILMSMDLITEEEYAGMG